MKKQEATLCGKAVNGKKYGMLNKPEKSQTACQLTNRGFIQSQYFIPEEQSIPVCRKAGFTRMTPGSSDNPANACEVII